jgi:threonine synthase
MICKECGCENYIEKINGYVCENCRLFVPYTIDNMNVTKIEDEDQIELKSGSEFKLSCCDCGLTHDVKFDIIKPNEIATKALITIKRNPKVTEEVRKQLFKEELKNDDDRKKSK